MRTSLVLALRDSFALQVDSPGEASLLMPWGIIRLPDLPNGLSRALERIGETGVAEDEIETMVLDRDGPDGLAHWYCTREALEARVALTYSVGVPGRVLARLKPMSSWFTARFEDVGLDERLVLSRFACLRREQGCLLVESPLSLARVQLFDPACAALVAGLGCPRPVRELLAAAPAIAEPEALDLLSMLSCAGMLCAPDEHGGAAGESTPAFRTWSFADLMFHSRSRRGRTDDSWGGTYPFAGEFPPLPAVKPPMSDDLIALAEPNAAAAAAGPTFSRVLESRRSVRAFDRRPIDARQLGEFLYRTVRIKSLVETPDPRRPHPISYRPYPSTGACHALEVYVVIERACDLPPGLYHYDPSRHGLEVLTTAPEMVHRLRHDVRLLDAASGQGAALIVIAARFRRMSWKYEAFAYAAILKDVGALIQTMYLVATAMDLAPCAIGGGDAELFARAIGAPFHEESSVGEFVLGRKSPEAPGPR